MWRVFVLLAGVLVAPAWGQTRASCLQQPALVCQASASLTGDWSLSGDITPAQIVATQNNYAPTGFATASVLLLTTDANRILTGLAGGADGRMVTLINANDTVVDASCTASVTPWACCTGSGMGTCGSTGNTFTIQLSVESASSTAANRFNIGTGAGLSHLILGVREAVPLRYDGVGSRWRPFANGLPRTGVVGMQYGNGIGTVYPRITVDEQGRLTQAVDATIDGLDVAAIDTGIFAFARGGTGAASYTAGNRCVRTNAGNTALEAAAGDCGTSGGYATIQEEAASLTQRATVNFIGTGMTCVDNAGSTRTDCTISSGGDVVGPASSVNGQIAFFSGTTGKLLVDSGNPANCSAGSLAAGIDAAGVAEGCASNIATATALAANGADCSAGQLAAGVDASGVSTGCASNIATATALAANGGNCSANQAAAGVDASGVAEGCFTPVGADLTAIEALTGTGLAARTAADTWALRTVAATAPFVTVTNGDGAAGNPTVAVPLMAAWAHAALGGF